MMFKTNFEVGPEFWSSSEKYGCFARPLKQKKKNKKQLEHSYNRPLKSLNDVSDGGPTITH